MFLMYKTIGAESPLPKWSESPAKIMRHGNTVLYIILYIIQEDHQLSWMLKMLEKTVTIS